VLLLFDCGFNRSRVANRLDVFWMVQKLEPLARKNRWIFLDEISGEQYFWRAVHVSSRDTSAPCSPSRLSLGTALVRRGFITKDTTVCRLIFVAGLRPYSATNEIEVWALQRTKKPAGLRLSVLTIKLFYIIYYIC